MRLQLAKLRALVPGLSKALRVEKPKPLLSGLVELTPLEIAMVTSRPRAHGVPFATTKFESPSVPADPLAPVSVQPHETTTWAHSVIGPRQRVAPHRRVPESGLVEWQSPDLRAIEIVDRTWAAFGLQRGASNPRAGISSLDLTSPLHGSEHIDTATMQAFVRQVQADPEYRDVKRYLRAEIELLPPDPSGKWHVRSTSGNWRAHSAHERSVFASLPFFRASPTAAPMHTPSQATKLVRALTKEHRGLPEQVAYAALYGFAHPKTMPEVAGSSGEAGADIRYKDKLSKEFGRTEIKAGAAGLTSFKSFETYLSYATRKQATNGLVIIVVKAGTDTTDWLPRFIGKRKHLFVNRSPDPQKRDAYRFTDLIIIDTNLQVALARTQIVTRWSFDSSSQLDYFPAQP